MGVAYYVILEQPIEGLEPEMDGKTLARYFDKLEKLASKLEVTPLSEFISMDPENVLGLEELADVDLPEIQYYSADQGLITINALLDDPSIKDENLRRDLLGAQRTLEAAAARNVSWRLELDF